jgi:translation initiation factor IF-2
MENTNRPPIVAILGHVDHGKTTLLDVIRKTSVASREAGGITQGIGASVAKTKEGKRITFIDTPGHAAFTKMRSRGAMVADLAVLVVDASDGVKPQTLESLEIIKEANIPFLVGITKIDLPAANVEGVLGQLEKEMVLFEGRGGDTPYLSLSAKKGQGIDELLETISLLAEVKGIKANAGSPLEAVVIETFKDKKGLLASVVVRNGTLKVGEVIFADKLEAKVRALTNFLGKSVKEILPGEPGQILGFPDLPQIGAVVSTDKDLALLKKAEIKRKDTYRKIGKDEIPVLLKTENTGAMEALQASLPPKVVVVDASVGEVLESDVLMARSTGARIFAFETKVSNNVLKLAEAEGVKIERFEIIYELLDRLNEIIQKGLVEVLGEAEVIASFPFDGKKIAGCKVLSGKISKGSILILKRGKKEVGKTKAISLRKQKNEINEAKGGEELGVLIEPQLDFNLGDMLVSVNK